MRDIRWEMDMADTTDLSSLIAEYKRLSRVADGLYSPSNYPGSKAWMAQRAAVKAAKEFEAAHPEVIEAIKAARKDPEYMTDPNSLYNRIRRGTD